MFRPVDKFREDLNHYYTMGFRPVLASEYLSNRMSIPSGTSPIVITFDDSTPSQIQLEKDGSLAPDCGLGIWKAFAKLHPDFPVHATFFVLPDVMWGAKKSVASKVKLLADLGCEIENHTTTHPKLSHLSDDAVIHELGNAEDKLNVLGSRGIHSLALPYGISPRTSPSCKASAGKAAKSTSLACSLSVPTQRHLRTIRNSIATVYRESLLFPGPTESTTGFSNSPKAALSHTCSPN